MFISNIKIENYRCFKDTSIDFVQGVNVIIGENNAGKSTLLQAIGLILNRRRRYSLSINDFFKKIPFSTEPPQIRITLTFNSSGKDKDTPAEKSLVATWLTSISDNWQAKLHFLFFLPEEEKESFKKMVETNTKIDHFWKTIEFFIPKFVTKIYTGNIDDRIKAEPDLLDKIDFQFLEPIRDVESSMHTGSQPLLKSMLLQVKDKGKSDQEKKNNCDAFDFQANTLIGSFINRFDVDSLFQLTEDTGANDGGKPKIEGKLSEKDAIVALNLVLDHNGLSIPVIQNGLGYNNLIFIALKLKSMEYLSSSEVSGQNATIFPVLAIEEPEAHLHPALQYKLLKYLRTRKNSSQTFITTHSTQITAASGLDPIILLSLNKDSSTNVVYPANVFLDTAAGKESKKYVERYLDATKSNMLFSKAVILVEGLAEQLILPILSEYIPCDLEKNHIAIIAVGGSTFKHFLPLFGAGSKNGIATMQCKVACILDSDPQRKLINNPKARFKSCFPFELYLDTATYEYREVSPVIGNLNTLTSGKQNILIKHNSKTFEYELALFNSEYSLLITDSCKWKEKLAQLSKSLVSNNENLSYFLEENTIQVLSQINSPDKEKVIFASAYLSATEEAKGEHALELAVKLKNNKTPEPGINPVQFTVPTYIKGAMEWICQRRG